MSVAMSANDNELRPVSVEKTKSGKKKIQVNKADPWQNVVDVYTRGCLPALEHCSASAA